LPGSAAACELPIAYQRNISRVVATRTFDTEFVRPVRVALADALNLWDL
jgi:hypothetical protein